MQTEPPKAEPPKRKRRWFQFSLRTLLIFTVVVAVAAGWLGRKMEQKRKEREAVEAILKLGGAITITTDEIGKIPRTRNRRVQIGCETLLGDNFFSEVRV